MQKNLSVALMLLVITVASLGARQAQPASVAAGQVKPFIGQFVVVEDTVAQVSREPQSGLVFLNFGAAFPNHVFRAIVPMSIERYLTGPGLQPGKVRVRGLAQLGPTGIPEIVCSDPSQVTSLGEALSVLGGVAAPQVTPTPTAKPCCRVCTSGKPCGNGCIAKTATCRQPPGCACGG